MGRVNWARVFLCGLLTGAVTSVLGGVIFTLWGRQIVGTQLPLGQPSAMLQAGWPLLLIIIINLVLGITALWIYAAIRPRYGAGPKTAAAAGFAVWLILCLDDVFFVVLGVFPGGPMVVPLAASLVGIIAAIELGAWLYKE